MSISSYPNVENHLRVDARGGVRLGIARHRMERDGDEVHRVALGPLCVTNPDHPPSVKAPHVKNARPQPHP